MITAHQMWVRLLLRVQELGNMPYKDKDKQRERNREYQKKHYQNKKQYYKDKAKERRIHLKEKLNEIKESLSCEKCGENNIAALDFHHTNPEEKDFSLSTACSRGMSIKKIKEEIDKCMILCSNCHRKLHYELRRGGEEVISEVS